MLRRIFCLTIPLLAVLPALAQDPAAPASTDTAPVAPAGATALLIANKAANFTLPLDKKALPALFRGLLQTTPAGQRVLIYVLPPGTPAQVEVLDKTMSWSETTFERQSQLVEASVGRVFFKRLNSSADVLAAVVADPGGIGIVSADTLLTPSVVILWPSGTP